MRNWLISLLFFYAFGGYAQTSDFEFFTAKSKEEKFVNYTPEYMFKESSAFLKFNPITAIPGGLMYLYQKVISPQIFADCLYEVSCSKFSILLIKRYGLIKGVALSADRLSRCNQFAAEGIKPVRINPKFNRVIDDIEWYHNH